MSTKNKISNPTFYIPINGKVGYYLSLDEALYNSDTYDVADIIQITCDPKYLATRLRMVLWKLIAKKWDLDLDKFDGMIDELRLLQLKQHARVTIYVDKIYKDDKCKFGLYFIGYKCKLNYISKWLPARNIDIHISSTIQRFCNRIHIDLEVYSTFPLYKDKLTTFTYHIHQPFDTGDVSFYLKSLHNYLRTNKDLIGTTPIRF